MSTRKALLWVIFWMGLAVLFNLGIYQFLGKEPALQFLGGYIIELSLSLDNLFLFLVIFSSFEIEPVYQRRILNYGILGAIILRFVFISLGVVVVNQFHWILYIFGLILLWSGLKMLFSKEKPQNFQDNPLLKIVGKIIPISASTENGKFFVRQDNILYATPLFAILVLIEFSDILFAIDSIPAIFSITTDPMIVFSSNIFAIIGLRSMYFLLEKLHKAFRFVKYGVAAILTFTGVKLVILYFHVEIPLIPSVITIFTILGLSILVSAVWKPANQIQD